MVESAFSAMFTSQVDTSVDLEEEKDQLRADGTKKDRYKSLIHVIRDHLYPCERHFYTTKDNQLRLPDQRAEGHNSRRKRQCAPRRRI
jgi:hypothetical protein